MMDDDFALNAPHDFGLLCTENREFMYTADGVATPASLNSDCLGVFDDEEACSISNMAAIDESSSLTESLSSTTALPDDKPKKVRKRNSVRDKMRSAAEQNAYKKLREMVPTLEAVKKPTKLQTVRHTLHYIEKLQEKLIDLERENTSIEGKKPIVTDERHINGNIEVRRKEKQEY